MLLLDHPLLVVVEILLLLGNSHTAVFKRPESVFSVTSKTLCYYRFYPLQTNYFHDIFLKKEMLFSFPSMIVHLPMLHVDYFLLLFINLFLLTVETKRPVICDLN